jgi:hypothetical protein
MVCTPANLALFPFTLGYLQLYAGWVPRAAEGAAGDAGRVKLKPDRTNKE